jgi:CheY-like chemotaxis protein
MRALVADDDRVGAAVLSATLQRWGLDVVTAQDGNEAWQIAQRDRDVGIAILDWVMPGLDGPELCRSIRRDASLRHMYIIMLTGRGNRPDIVAGLDAGADDYVVKPFDEDELRARVQVGLRVASLQQNLTQRVEELQSALSRVKTLTGLLPICSYCKRIRSDHDYWEQLESYIAHHSDAQFSHGICPSCFDTVSAQFEGRGTVDARPEHPRKPPAR